jgi:hypothetical protein
VRHAFAITNEGDDVLRISDVTTSCGCTVAELAQDGKILAPGESTEILATLSLKGRKGKLSKVIRVKSNDPKDPLFQLSLTGTVFAPIDVDPTLVNFGTIADDDPHSRTVSIAATEPGLTFRLVDVESSTDSVRLATETLEDGKRYKLTVSTVPGLDPGRILGTITVQTDHPVYTSQEIRITGDLLGDYRVSPPSILLPPVSAHVSEPLARQFTVGPGRRDRFKILTVEPPSEQIGYQLEELGPSFYRVRLSIANWEGLHGKHLAIITDAPGEKRLEIPIRTLETTSQRRARYKEAE